MSFSENDRNFRAGDGKKFPLNPSADTDATFAAVIADALRRDFGATPAHVKHIARLTGANLRSVQNWVQARNGPSGSALIVLMRHSEEVTSAVLLLSDRQELHYASLLKKRMAQLRIAMLAVLNLLDPMPAE